MQADLLLAWEPPCHALPPCLQPYIQNNSFTTTAQPFPSSTTKKTPVLLLDLAAIHLPVPTHLWSGPACSTSSLWVPQAQPHPGPQAWQFGLQAT